MRSRSLFILLSLVLISGCSVVNNAPTKHVEQVKHPVSDIIIANEKGIDKLLDSSASIIDNTKPIIVTSLVNVNHLEKSSPIGRMSADIIANRLAIRGYRVKEVKMGQRKVFIRRGGGEFVLSRDISEIAREFNTQVVIVGTYTLGENINFEDIDGMTFCKGVQRVYISLRAIRTEDNTICGAANYSLAVKNLGNWQ